MLKTVKLCHAPTGIGMVLIYLSKACEPTGYICIGV